MEASLEPVPGPGGPPATSESRGPRCPLLSGFREELRALLVLAGPAVSLVASAAGWSRRVGSAAVRVAACDWARVGTEPGWLAQP